MDWEDARQRRPAQWIVIEALTWQDEAEKRLVTDLVVLECFGDDSR